MATNRIKKHFEVAKTNPVDPVESLLWRDPFEWFFGGALTNSICLAPNLMPQSSLNVSDLEDRYEATLDAPGFSKEELKVSLKHGVLTVTGKQEKNEENRKSRSEIRHSIYIGEGLDSDKIEAQHKDGVLTIKIPKGDDPKSREIEIK